MSWPGRWLNWFVCIERTSAMSSAQVAMFGSRSLISMPHCPCFLKTRLVPITVALSFCKNANFASPTIESGNGWPSYLFSSGFGSKRSIWDGPPSRKMKMQRSAFGAKCDIRVASGFAGMLASSASKPSCFNNEAKASVPSPHELVARKSRRVWVMYCSKGDIKSKSDDFVSSSDDYRTLRKSGNPSFLPVCRRNIDILARNRAFHRCPASLSTTTSLSRSPYCRRGSLAIDELIEVHEHTGYGDEGGGFGGLGR